MTFTFRQRSRRHPRHSPRVKQNIFFADLITMHKLGLRIVLSALLVAVHGGCGDPTRASDNPTVVNAVATTSPINQAAPSDGIIDVGRPEDQTGLWSRSLEERNQTIRSFAEQLSFVDAVVDESRQKVNVTAEGDYLQAAGAALGHMTERGYKLAGSECFANQFIIDLFFEDESGQFLIWTQWKGRRSPSAHSIGLYGDPVPEGDPKRWDTRQEVLDLWVGGIDSLPGIDPSCVEVGLTPT